MATKNYMINDKWLDLDKQNIVELQSVDGELDSLKVNGSEVVTPSGKIAITENGTDIDIAQYALADVNVEGGSGDFSTAEITIINNSGATVLLGDIINPTFQITSDFRKVNLDTEIANNGTLVLDLLTPIDLGDVWIAGVVQEPVTCVVSNMVNCTVNDDNIFITDPLQNSSCTVTAS